MRAVASALIVAGATLALAGCSEQTQEDAELTAERAATDAEANLDVVGEAIEEGASDAAGAISEGAAQLQSEIEEGDTEEPGPAPITGDDLSQ